MSFARLEYILKNLKQFPADVVSRQSRKHNFPSSKDNFIFCTNYSD